MNLFIQLYASAVLALTQIPRKNVIIDWMSKSVLFSSIDLMSALYQILLLEKNIPCTTVSSPSGLQCKSLDVPEGLIDFTNTSNRCVTNSMISVASFAPSYSYVMFLHNRNINGKLELKCCRRYAIMFFTTA